MINQDYIRITEKIKSYSNNIEKAVMYLLYYDFIMLIIF